MPIFSRPFFLAPAAACQRVLVGPWRNSCRASCTTQQLDAQQLEVVGMTGPLQGSPTPTATEGLQSSQIVNPSSRLLEHPQQDVQLGIQHAPPGYVQLEQQHHLPQQPQEPSGADAQAITHQIKCASTLRQLQQALQQHRSCLNCIHIVAALQVLLRLQHPWSSCSSLGHMPYSWQRPPTQQQVKRTRQRVYTQPQTSRQPRHSHHPQQQGSAELQACTGTTQPGGRQPKQPLTREQSMARQQDREQQRAQQEACARQHAYSLLFHRQGGDPQLLAACMVQFLIDQAERQLPQMTLREVTACFNCLLGLPAAPNRKYFMLLMGRAEQLYQHNDTNLWGMSQLLHCIATSGMQGLRPDWARRFYAAISARHEQLDIRSTTRILHASVCLQQQLPLDTAQHLLDAFCRHAHDAHPRDISIALWAIVRLRLPVAQHVVETILAHAHRLLPHVVGRELSLVLWSLSCIHLQQAGEHHSRHHAATPSEVHSHSSSLVNGYTPSHSSHSSSINSRGNAWGHSTVGSSSNVSSCCDSGHVSSTWPGPCTRQVSSPCMLGGSAWQQAAVAAAEQQLPLLEGQSLALLVYALARLQWQVDSNVLHNMLWTVQDTGFRRLTAQGMALLLHGVVKLGYEPDRGWLSAFRARLNSLDGADHAAVKHLVTGSLAVVQRGTATTEQQHTGASRMEQCQQMATLHAHALAQCQMVSPPKEELHPRPDRFMLQASSKVSKTSKAAGDKPGKQKQTGTRLGRQQASKAAPDSMLATPLVDQQGQQGAAVLNGHAWAHRPQEQWQQEAILIADSSQPVDSTAGRHIDLQSPQELQGQQGHDLQLLLQPEHLQMQQLTPSQAHQQLQRQPTQVPLEQVHHALQYTDARHGMQAGLPPNQEVLLLHAQQDGLPTAQQDTAPAAQQDLDSVCHSQVTSSGASVSTQQYLIAQWGVGPRKEGDLVDRLKAMCPV